MVKIILKLDKLTSLLVSYHILSAPSELSKKYNPEIFKNLKISPKEKRLYKKWLSTKISLEKSDSFKQYLFIPLAKNLNFCFSKLEIENKGLVKSIKDFQKPFFKYLKIVGTKINSSISARNKESQRIINKVYNYAFKFSGVKIEIPKLIEVRIIEGISPMSVGTSVTNGVGYVAMQVSNLLSEGDSYLLSLIHETVAHKIARPSRDHFGKIFGRYIYDLEEGFAKLFSRKIAEEILNREVYYPAGKGVQEISYKIFEKNWKLLNGKNFDSWFGKCLSEIKIKI